MRHQFVAKMKAIDHGCADACFCEAVEHMVDQAAAIDFD
jgi:hypothetical protein